MYAKFSEKKKLENFAYRISEDSLNSHIHLMLFILFHSAEFVFRQIRRSSQAVVDTFETSTKFNKNDY